MKNTESTDIVASGTSVLRGRDHGVFMSVVIPTFRRPDCLTRVLAALEHQIASLEETVEVVVCDDASHDGTVDILRRHTARSRFPFTWVTLARNGGPARARNHAVRQAGGIVVLLIGDDIVPGVRLLDRHVAWHRAHPADEDALLGYTTWPPDLDTTPLMKWLEGRGRRFFLDYGGLSTKRPVSGMKFYTCNVSFKRALLARVGAFDEGFKFASHEDLELGLRLERAGMRLYYDPLVVGYHWHALDLPGMAVRVHRMGYSAVRFWQMTGETGSAGCRLCRRIIVALVTRCAGSSCLRAYALLLKYGAAGRFAPLLWGPLLQAAYWKGVADGQRCESDQTGLIQASKNCCRAA